MEKKTQKTQKKYACKKCDYLSSNKYDYKRHLKTIKHTMITYDNKMITKKTHKCLCGKTYNHRANLSRHKKNCRKNKEEIGENTKNKKENELANPENVTKLLKTILQENRELKKEMKNLKINNITNNNNNTNNISINVFLNEYCKDAMSLTDFVNKIIVSIADLENTKELGFVDGISNVILKNLKDMSSVERPFHSSDTKRSKFFIKDTEGWKKDASGEQIDDAITKIKIKHVDALGEWELKNPEYTNNNEKSEEWSGLLDCISSGEDKKETEKNKKQVKKNIAERCSVKKAIEDLDK
jgi:hypothetical protein